MATDDVFRARIDQMIGLSHPLLAVLARRTPWGDYRWICLFPADRVDACLHGRRHPAYTARLCISQN